MNKIFFFFSISFMTLTVSAQADSLVFSNMSKAQEYAAEHEKDILMVFAGSDWCRPCIQFKKEILESEQFNEYANQNLVVLYLDFPARRANKLTEEQTEHNEQLAEKYNSQGAFPKIILVNKDAEVLNSIDFKNQGSEVFIEECKTVLAEK